VKGYEVFEVVVIEEEICYLWKEIQKSQVESNVQHTFPNNSNRSNSTFSSEFKPNMYVIDHKTNTLYL
jgi:hypothetical protein